MDHETIRKPELLLAESAWLKALAVRLVLDPERAEDLVQDTYVAALRHPPRRAQSLRFWLARVMRHFVLRERVRESRRGDWERAGARAEAIESTAAVVARVAMQREIVNALLALAEPYRSTIVLRFFEDLSPRAIAARESIPLGTVRTRLRRGLAMLRERLDREHGGDRMAWCSPLAALVRPAPASMSVPVVPLLTGVLAMTAKTKMAVLAVVLIALSSSAWLILRDDGPAAATRAGSVSRLGPSGIPSIAPVPDRPDLATQTAKRTEVAGLAPVDQAGAPSIEPPSAASSELVHGFVFGATGTPISGVRVGYRDQAPAASASDETKAAIGMSRADGSFSLPASGATATIVSTDPAYATVLGATVDASTIPMHKEIVVVVAPKIQLAGVVLDERERPVADATVVIRTPFSLRTQFHTSLDGTRDQEWRATSQRDGSFHLSDAPAIPFGLIEAWRSGLGSASLEVPAADDSQLRIVLQRRQTTDPERVTVAGVVLNLEGQPLPAPLVWLGESSARADREGRFEFTIARRTGSPRRLLALWAGALPALYTPAHDANGDEVWPEFLELRLGGPAKSIAGRVLDAEGHPLAEAPVWVNDPTYLGRSEDEGKPITVENQTHDNQDSFTQTRTDPEGRFELGGLLDHDYEVVGANPSTAETTMVSVGAGRRDVEIRFSTDGLWDEISGRAIDRHGQPVAGLHVRIVNPGCLIKSTDGGNIWGNGGVRRDGGQTDDGGHFAIKNVPRENVKLCLEDDRILPVEHPLSAREGATGIEVQVSLRCHVQFELEQDVPGSASFALLDGQEKKVTMWVFGDGNTWGFGSVEFTGKISAVVSAPDLAETAVILDKDGKELRRLPVALDPGRLNTIKF